MSAELQDISDVQSISDFVDSLRIVDVHVHVWNEQLAPRVCEKFTQARQAMVERELARSPELRLFLDENESRIHTDCTIPGMQRHMDACGVAKSVILPVATKPTQVENINAWLLPYIDHPRFLPFASVHPDCDDPVGVVRRVAELGFKGIKLHPQDQGFRPQEPRMLPIYQAIAQEGLFVLFHAGPVAGGDVNDRQSAYDFDEMLQHFVYDKTILAHLGGFMGMKEMPQDFVFDRPGYVDMAYTLGITPPDIWLEMVRRFGAERVLYGSDSPWRSEKVDIDRIKTSGLNAREMQLILQDNAARLFGI